MLYQVFNLIFSWFALVRLPSPSIHSFISILAIVQANYFIAFTILAQSMEDPSFNLKGINIVNDILSYFYLGLLIMCFILALGNRPQGSKWGYTMAFIGFGVITIYMTVRFFSSPLSDKREKLMRGVGRFRHSCWRLKGYKIYQRIRMVKP
jgi:chitin synthase